MFTANKSKDKRNNIKLSNWCENMGNGKGGIVKF